MTFESHRQHGTQLTCGKGAGQQFAGSEDRLRCLEQGSSGALACSQHGWRGRRVQLRVDGDGGRERERERGRESRRRPFLRIRRQGRLRKEISRRQMRLEAHSCAVLACERSCSSSSRRRALASLPLVRQHALGMSSEYAIAQRLGLGDETRVLKLGRSFTSPTTSSTNFSSRSSAACDTIGLEVDAFHTLRCEYLSRSPCVLRLQLPP